MVRCFSSRSEASLSRTAIFSPRVRMAACISEVSCPALRSAPICFDVVLRSFFSASTAATFSRRSASHSRIWSTSSGLAPRLRSPSRITSGVSRIFLISIMVRNGTKGVPLEKKRKQKRGQGRSVRLDHTPENAAKPPSIGMTTPVTKAEA